MRENNRRGGLQACFWAKVIITIKMLMFVWWVLNRLLPYWRECRALYHWLLFVTFCSLRVTQHQWSVEWLVNEVQWMLPWDKASTMMSYKEWICISFGVFWVCFSFKPFLSYFFLFYIENFTMTEQNFFFSSKNICPLIYICMKNLSYILKFFAFGWFYYFTQVQSHFFFSF